MGGHFLVQLGIPVDGEQLRSFLVTHSQMLRRFSEHFGNRQVLSRRIFFSAERYKIQASLTDANSLIELSRAFGNRQAMSYDEEKYYRFLAQGLFIAFARY